MEPIASVRNATKAAKQFASTPIGQLVRIEVLVSVCCLFVGVVVLCNSRRRHERRGFPRLVFWAAFVLHYPLIAYTIGLMQSSSIQNELFVVWASFLVLLLGSADAVTAFSFHESSQQTKSMMNQGLHIVYLLLLILYYKGQLRYSFLISLFLLWSLSVVRLGLRAKAYRSTCRSRGLVRENQIVMDYMKRDPPYFCDPKTMEGYIYLVNGKAVERVRDGEKVIEVPHRKPLKRQREEVIQEPYQVPPETVDIEMVWQCKGKLLGSSDRGASRRRDLCLSFALFRLLRLRFAADYIGNINFQFGAHKWQHFIVDGLLSDDQDLDRAFRVVETELGFLFDFFYSRYPAIEDTLAPDLIVYAAILATSIFTLLSLNILKYRPKEGGTDIFINDFNLDLFTTHLVILWYIFMESYQFLAFICSDWHKVKIMCWYVRNTSWHNRLLVEFPLKVLCDFTLTKYRNGTMGQYFILDNTHPHWFKSFLSWISFQFIDTWLTTSYVSLDSNVRHAVLRQLKTCNSKITDGRVWLYDMGVIDLDLDRECMSRHTYARYILTWHVATSICSYGLNMKNASAELVKNHGVATKLSGYCAYLLFYQPELIPDITNTCVSIARGTLKNARDYLADCKSNQAKYEKLIQLGRTRNTDRDVKYLSQGAQIAVQLLERSRIKDDEGRWEMLARFWANMMLYIAPSDRAVAHATKMASGGEFITIIWALLTHAHVVDKIQKLGTPGLHILLEIRRRKQQEDSGVSQERSFCCVKEKKDSGHASIEGGSLDNC